MASWAELLTREADRAYLIALRAAGDPALAEEAVQEAFLRMLRGQIPELAPGALRAYLFRTVHNMALNLATSATARHRREEAVVTHEERAAPSPDESAEAAETARAARAALAALPVELRTAVSLCCEQGLSHREAGEVLGIPKDTVTDRVRRGLGRLQQVLTASGFASCAPTALAAGLGTLGVPAAPAGLVAAIDGLVKGGAGKVSAGVAATAAAKGGLTVKIVAGIVLAGTLAAGVGVVSSNRKPDALPAPPGPAADRTYTCEQLFRTDVGLSSYYLLDGPRSSAHIGEIRGLVQDAEGNFYGLLESMVGRGGDEGRVSHECVIVKWDRKTDRVTRLAGGARGAALDGPGETAQFNFQCYLAGGLGIDRPRGLLYLADLINGGLRCIRIKDGRVTTPDPQLVKVISVAADQDGVVFAVGRRNNTGGLYRLTAQGPAGEETFKVELVGEALKQTNGAYLAADARRGRVYLAGRESDISTVQVWDLKAGGLPARPAPLAAPSGSKARYSQSDGPLEGATFWCPCGLSLSPDGRYLYFGGGDEFTYRRIDVDARRIASLYRTAGYNEFGSKAGDGYVWRERKEEQKLFNWPMISLETEDGTFYICGASPGIFRLTPKPGAGKGGQ